jgi:hypothetical protein
MTPIKGRGSVTHERGLWPIKERGLWPLREGPMAPYLMNLMARG